MVSNTGGVSRIHLLISKISHVCQEICDIKEARKPKSNVFKPNYTITSLDEGQKDRNYTQEPGSSNSAKAVLNWRLITSPTGHWLSLISELSIWPISR